MRLDQYVVLLDACVLAPMPVCDTLLRLAEEPAFYAPKWSWEILDEVSRTLVMKLRRSPEQAANRIAKMIATFPEAMVEGYSELIPSITNDQKDRHVIAAAIRCGANAIVTDNTRHFPRSSLEPYKIECLTADQFIEDQYHLDEDGFIEVLNEQARAIGWSVPQLMAKHVPCLSRLIVARK